MSCMIVSDVNLSAVAQLAYLGTYATPQTRQAFAQALHEMNLRSHAAVYRDEPTAEPGLVHYEHSPRVDALTPVQVLKLCHFVEYNLDSAPDYQGSDCARVLHQLTVTAAKRLDGYDEAGWGLD